MNPDDEPDALDLADRARDERDSDHYYDDVNDFLEDY